MKRSNSEGDVNVTTGPRSASPHRSATVPLSRDPSPAPHPSHHHSHIPPEHHPPVEDPDLSTEAALLEVQHPPLRHKTSSSSEKSKRRFLGIRRVSPSPSPALGSRPSSHTPSPSPSLENLRTPSPELPISTSPPPGARPTGSPVPSGQSSLLSTLKSRAGDRQALSNTAKETMRKWAVNWGRKDRESSVSSSAHAQNGRDDKFHATSLKVKSSYAEIRAAVDGRKEGRSSEGPSTPIHIPDRGHKGRTGSVSSMHHPQGSSLSSTQTESSSAGWPADPWVDETSPELSSQRPPAIDADRAQLDAETVNGDEPAPATTTPTPVPPPRPIQSQPSQGKTMTIPGIHARNRGEVMSMGYIPPSPPAPEVKPGVSSVYRLWKYSPVSSEQPDGDGNAEHAGIHSPPVLTADSAEASPELTPTATYQPQAPPLPPRTLGSLHPVPSASDSSQLSPASAALKSIASRDEYRAQDGEGIEASSSPPVSPKPPLPPRKIHTHA